MTETEVKEALQAIIGYGEPIENTNLDGASARSYEDSGIMTCNEGLVIRTADGSEFQITIVQSR
ncbi:MAG: hypothetical protein QME73_07815 [Bacillota bacterium]|nr:hypothetical protein [Bacillota bacterium]